MMGADAFIYAQSDGYILARDRIMGRQVAGRGFVQAVLQHPSMSPQFLVPHPSEIPPLQRFADDLGLSRKPIAIAASLDDPRIAAAGAISYFDVSKFVEATWRRRARGLDISLLGLTHSISDPISRTLVGALARVPTCSHDALVCTSRAIRDAALRMIEAEADDLARRFGGIRPASLPQMPIIPLGIDLPLATDDARAQLRAEWRARLGIGTDDAVALFFGRISFHAKAHPLPMYVGLEEAARGSARRVHLIQAGWFPNPEIERAFQESAFGLAPSVSHHFLDGRQDDIRTGIWPAADFFVSLSDTMEESFGLTPIEAMAQGLPVVLSDWDGYRDNVQNGNQGFLIPTIMPAPNAGAGADIALLHAEEALDFDSYEGFASLATAVDVDASAQAFFTLINDPGLCRQMGAKAYQHAHSNYGWPTILDQHRTLWAELGRQRAARPDKAAIAPLPHPLHQDPFWLFAGHAAATLQGHTQLVARRVDRAYIDLITSQHMNLYGRDHIAPNPLTANILAMFEAGGATCVAEIEGKFPAADAGMIALSLGWLLKMGLIGRKG